MTIIRNSILVFSTAVLGACSTAPTTAPFTPSISSTAQVDAGLSYSVTQNGVTNTLGTRDGTILGATLAVFTTTSLGAVYDTADVVAIAGKERAGPSYTTYAGISGTPSSTVPTTGTGTYVGNFNVNYYRAGTTNSTYWSNGAFTTYVDFDAGTLIGTGTDTGSAGGVLAVSGALQGAQFNGTAYFTAQDFAGDNYVPMTGGLYGANTVAGIFQDGEIAGVFFGQ